MAKEVDRYFNINHIRENLNRINKEDRKHYLNMIVSTLVVSCSDTPEEAVRTLEQIKNGIMKIKQNTIITIK